MAMIQAADIQQMTVEERLQAIELLWASVAQAPNLVPSPSWHQDVLARRLAKIEEGHAEYLTLAQLKERLSKPTT